MVQTLGKWAEDLACSYLLNQNLQLISRNYACRWGEIDLIMQDKETLVFIEVRYRKNKKFASSLETVNFVKQNKLIKTAEHYLQSRSLSDKVPCRFDVIGIHPIQTHFLSKHSLTSQLPFPHVEWVKNAFTR